MMDKGTDTEHSCDAGSRIQMPDESLFLNGVRNRRAHAFLHFSIKKWVVEVVGF